MDDMNEWIRERAVQERPMGDRQVDELAARIIRTTSPRRSRQRRTILWAAAGVATLTGATLLPAAATGNWPGIEPSPFEAGVADSSDSDDRPLGAGTDDSSFVEDSRAELPDEVYLPSSLDEDEIRERFIISWTGSVLEDAGETEISLESGAVAQAWELAAHCLWLDELATADSERDDVRARAAYAALESSFSWEQISSTFSGDNWNAYQAAVHVRDMAVIMQKRSELCVGGDLLGFMQ